MRIWYRAKRSIWEVQVRTLQSGAQVGLVV
jgi:hypothetical protein